MLFATTTIAARIEGAECSLVRESAQAVADVRPEANVMIKPLAGGMAIYAGEGSPLNKVVGLGLEGPVDEAELGIVEGLYADRNCPVQIELSSLAHASVGVMLTGRGYQLVGFENVLGRVLSNEHDITDPVIADITVDVIAENDFNLWMDTMVTGFASPDLDGVPSHESFPSEVLERVMRDMNGATGFVRYLAHRHGAPAGGGSMRIADGVLQLCGAATLPNHRRRGVQAALLAHRLADAARRGCDLAVVTTQPGSTSQRNMQRNGFELLYTRAILMRNGPRVESV